MTLRFGGDFDREFAAQDAERAAKTSAAARAMRVTESSQVSKTSFAPEGVAYAPPESQAGSPKTMLDSGPMMPGLEMKWTPQASGAPASSGAPAPSSSGPSALTLLGIGISLWKIFG